MEKIILQMLLLYFYYGFSYGGCYIFIRYWRFFLDIVFQLVKELLYRIGAWIIRNAVLDCIFGLFDCIANYIALMEYRALSITIT